MNRVNRPSKQYLENLAANPRFNMMLGSRRMEIANALTAAQSSGVVTSSTGESVDLSSLPVKEQNIIKSGGVDEWHKRYCVQIGDDKTWVRKKDLEKVLTDADEETKTRLIEGEKVWQAKYGVQVGADKKWTSASWYDALSDEDKKEIADNGLDKFTESHYVTVGNNPVRKEWYETLPASEQDNLKAKGFKEWQSEKIQQYLGNLPDISGVQAEFFGNPMELQIGLVSAEGSSFVKLGTGEYVPLNEWNKLSKEGQALLYKIGVNSEQALAIARSDILSKMESPMMRYAEAEPEQAKIYIAGRGAIGGPPAEAVSASYILMRGSSNEAQQKAKQYFDSLVSDKVLPLLAKAYPNASQSELQSKLTTEKEYLLAMMARKDTSGYSDYNKNLSESLSKNFYGFSNIAQLLGSRLFSTSNKLPVPSELENFTPLDMSVWTPPKNDNMITEIPSSRWQMVKATGRRRGYLPVFSSNRESVPGGSSLKI